MQPTIARRSARLAAGSAAAGEDGRRSRRRGRRRGVGEGRRAAPPPSRRRSMNVPAPTPAPQPAEDTEQPAPERVQQVRPFAGANDGLAHSERRSVGRPPARPRDASGQYASQRQTVQSQAEQFIEANKVQNITVKYIKLVKFDEKGDDELFRMKGIGPGGPPPPVGRGFYSDKSKRSGGALNRLTRWREWWDKRYQDIDQKGFDEVTKTSINPEHPKYDSEMAKWWEQFKKAYEAVLPQKEWYNYKETKVDNMPELYDPWLLYKERVNGVWRSELFGKNPLPMSVRKHFNSNIFGQTKRWKTLILPTLLQLFGLPRTKAFLIASDHWNDETYFMEEVDPIEFKNEMERKIAQINYWASAQLPSARTAEGKHRYLSIKCENPTNCDNELLFPIPTSSEEHFICSCSQCGWIQIVPANSKFAGFRFYYCFACCQLTAVNLDSDLQFAQCKRCDTIVDIRSKRTLEPFDGNWMLDSMTFLADRDPHRINCGEKIKDLSYIPFNELEVASDVVMEAKDAFRKWSDWVCKHCLFAQTSHDSWNFTVLRCLCCNEPAIPSLSSIMFECFCGRNLELGSGTSTVQCRDCTTTYCGVTRRLVPPSEPTTFELRNGTTVLRIRCQWSKCESLMLKDGRQMPCPGYVDWPFQQSSDGPIAIDGITSNAAMMDCNCCGSPHANPKLHPNLLRSVKCSCNLVSGWSKNDETRSSFTCLEPTCKNVLNWTPNTNFNDCESKEPVILPCRWCSDEKSVHHYGLHPAKCLQCGIWNSLRHTLAAPMIAQRCLQCRIVFEMALPTSEPNSALYWPIQCPFCQRPQSLFSPERTNSYLRNLRAGRINALQRTEWTLGFHHYEPLSNERLNAMPLKVNGQWFGHRYINLLDSASPPSPPPPPLLPPPPPPPPPPPINDSAPQSPSISSILELSPDFASRTSKSTSPNFNINDIGQSPTLSLSDKTPSTASPSPPPPVQVPWEPRRQASPTLFRRSERTNYQWVAPTEIEDDGQAATNIAAIEAKRRERNAFYKRNAIHAASVISIRINAAIEATAAEWAALPPTPRAPPTALPVSRSISVSPMDVAVPRPHSSSTDMDVSSAAESPVPIVCAEIPTDPIEDF